MYNVSENYKNTVYDDETLHLLKIYINDVEVNEDDILGFDQEYKLFSDDVITLGTTTSQSIKLQLVSTAVPDTIEKVYIETGIEGETIPLGYFNLESISKDGDYTTTLNLLDNMIKFEFNYDGSALIDEKGSATVLEVLQDICDKAEIELGSTSFVNDNVSVAVYDNSVTARAYVGYIAEQAGGFACIGRDGKLYIKNIESIRGEELTSGNELEIQDKSIVELNIEGKCEQNKFEGYNLLGLVDNTYTLNGITAIVKNGEITINGTATATTFMGLTQKSTIDYSKMTNFSVYLFNNQLHGGLRFRIDSGAQQDIPAYYHVNEVSTLSYNSGLTYQTAMLRIENGTTFNDVKLKPMIINGTDTTKIYEQYVGGTSSPNPEYPQEIKTIGEKANLFNKNDVNELTAYFSTGTSVITSTSGARTIYISCKPNTEYKVSKIASSRFYIGYTTTEPTLGTQVYGAIGSIDTSVTNYSITTGSNATHLCAFIYYSTSDTTITYNEILDTLKIEEINGLLQVQIKTSNKNLFNGNYEKAYIGGDNQKTFIASDTTKTAIIKCEPNTTYTVTKNIGTRFCIAEASIKVPINVGTVTVLYRDHAETQATVTTSENGNYLYVYVDNANTNGILTQIEKGQVATEYVEHKEQSIILQLQKEFCGTEDFKDTFVKKNGKWYEKHYYKKYIFDGTEAFYTDSYNRAHVPVPTDMLYSTTEPNKYKCLSNRFTFDIDIFYNISANVFGVYQSGRLYFSLNGTNITTREQWLDYIKQNELYIIYPLKEPELIQCTEEQIEILNKLYDLEVYPGGTYISTDFANLKLYSKVGLDIEMFGSFAWGDETTISRVYYEDGVQRFESGTEENSTLYINQENMYIVSQEQVDSAGTQINGLKVNSFEGSTIIDPALDVGDIILIDNKPSIYQGTMNYAGKMMANISSNLQCKEKEENMVQTPSQTVINRRIQSRIDQEAGTITQLVETTQQNVTDINNNYQEIIDKLGDYAKTDELISVQNSVTTIQSSTQYAIEVAESIKTNGVERVTTTTGFTFDEDGLTVEKTGAHTKSILDETGLDVRDTTSGSEEDLLFAGVDSVTGEAIVKSKNITVDKYLVVGKYTRFEDYKDANNVNWTGAFWIGG